MTTDKRGMADFIVEVLNEADMPLTYSEIWNQGNEKGIIPPKSDNPNQMKYLSSVLTGWDDELTSDDVYVYKDGTKIKLFSRSPRRWYIVDKFNKNDIDKFPEKIDKAEKKEERIDAKNEIEGKNCQIELMLYPFLTKYVKEKLGVSVIAISDKKAKKAILKRGLKKWQYPDLVGFSVPYDKSINEMKKVLGSSPVLIYSFEMKREIKTRNFCECYYQALSNSSWANYGYLVTDTLDDDDTDMMSALKLLNERFGIGIIKLNTKRPNDGKGFDIRESKILFEAKFNPEINWDVFRRNIRDNEDEYKTFCNAVTTSIDDPEKLNYDECLKDFEKPWEDGGKKALDDLEKEKNKQKEK